MADSLESLRQCPPLNSDIIQYLDSMIPHRCPSISDEDRAIWMYAGKRELIDFLKKRHLEQINKAFGQ